MAEKKENRITIGGCLGSVTGMAFSAIPLFVIGFILYKIWQFFAAPDLLARLSDGLIALGMCFGIVILVLFLITKIPESWFGKHIDDWN